MSWEGLSAATAACNCTPPAPVGAVGPNHYLQAVAGAFAVFDKAGTVLYGPTRLTTLWSGFGLSCEATNDLDPASSTTNSPTAGSSPTSPLTPPA